MADVKISALATATTSIGTTIAVVEGGVTKKVVVASAFDYLLSNDGNGGQPPAPKPNVGVGSMGEWKKVEAADGISLVLPAGGTWAYNLIIFNTASGTIGAGFSAASVAAGGSTIYPGVSGKSSFAFCWREA